MRPVLRRPSELSDDMHAQGLIVNIDIAGSIFVLEATYLPVLRLLKSLTDHYSQAEQSSFSFTYVFPPQRSWPPGI